MNIAVASKVKHAGLWRSMRASGCPIISTWIDDASIPKASRDINDLWRRSINEAAYCDAFIIYRELDDTLEGALIELGAALARGTPVFAVGLRDLGVAKYNRIRHFDDLDSAMQAATSKGAALPVNDGQIGGAK